MSQALYRVLTIEKLTSKSFEVVKRYRNELYCGTAAGTLRHSSSAVCQRSSLASLPKFGRTIASRYLGLPREGWRLRGRWRWGWVSSAHDTFIYSKYDIHEGKGYASDIRQFQLTSAPPRSCEQPSHPHFLCTGAAHQLRYIHHRAGKVDQWPARY